MQSNAVRMDGGCADITRGARLACETGDCTSLLGLVRSGQPLGAAARENCRRSRSSSSIDDDDDDDGVPSLWSAPRRRTPLMVAAYNGHIECVQLLLSVGASGGVAVDAVDEYGANALRYACMGGNLDIAELLAGEPGIHVTRSLALNPCMSVVSAFVQKRAREDGRWQRRRTIILTNSLRHTARGQSLCEVGSRLNPPLFDAHAHLHLPRFASHLDSTLQAATAAGVAYVAVNAVCEDDWSQLEALVARADSSCRSIALLPQFGVHPCVAATLHGVPCTPPCPPASHVVPACA